MKYRKRPVEVEAFQLTDDTKYPHWFVSEAFKGKNIVINDDNTVDITTLEGVMHASKGDYIIKGINGEFYPCKPDIFEATYEQVK